MQKAQITVRRKGHDTTVTLQKGHCIAIPLDDNHPQPNAFYAPLYEASPHEVNNWIGDTRKGSPVNFYNLRLNPHGNGTHTECVGHIAKERYAIHETLADGFWLAQLITVLPTRMDNGDRVIDRLEWDEDVEAIILRTQPNDPEKQFRQYSGTNPPYLDAGLAQRMAEAQIQHLLLDLPSVDREEDGGVLAAHKAFWQYPSSPRLGATITEMIYVSDEIPDGVYLVQIQIPALMLDASPSRPFIYPLK
jgi:kynurenine formamidase